MTEQAQNLTMLSRLEATTIQQFITQVDMWQQEYGDKANTVEVTYYPEYDGFEVVNGETNNGLIKRNIATRFRNEISGWAANQIKNLQGWDNAYDVTAFSVSFRDNRYGVLCTIASKSANTEQPHGEVSES